MPPLALPAKQHMERAQAIWAELGLPAVDATPLFGLVAPARLPAAVQQKLEQSLERVARNEEVKAAMLKAGAEPT